MSSTLRHLDVRTDVERLHASEHKYLQGVMAKVLQGMQANKSIEKLELYKVMDTRQDRSPVDGDFERPICIFKSLEALCTRNKAAKALEAFAQKKPSLEALFHQFYTLLQACNRYGNLGPVWPPFRDLLIPLILNGSAPRKIQSLKPTRKRKRSKSKR